MRQVRAIIIGIIIWIFGASFYTASYFIPILEDAALQANLMLAITFIPLAWLGAWIYYKKASPMHGLKLGVIMILTGITLDALITVPYFIIPYGGSYRAFFTSPAFWVLAMEYLLVILGYWHFKIKAKRIEK